MILFFFCSLLLVLDDYLWCYVSSPFFLCVCVCVCVCIFIGFWFVITLHLIYNSLHLCVSVCIYVCVCVCEIILSCWFLKFKCILTTLGFYFPLPTVYSFWCHTSLLCVCDPLTIYCEYWWFSSFCLLIFQLDLWVIDLLSFLSIYIYQWKFCFNFHISFCGLLLYTSVQFSSVHFSSVQSLSRVWLFVIPYFL